MAYFVLSSLSIFLNTETNVATNINPLNSGNISISLLSIAYSVSSCFSSGVKKKNLTVKNLQNF